jgi:CubicO group peptidase (beta-lactamase class C family)
MDASGLEELLVNQHFTGVVDLRRGGEQIFAGSYGLASPRWGAPNTASTRFDVASISKLFTSVAVLQLVERKQLDLDTSIHEYAELTGTTISPEVTLRQLLTHRSGIADIAEEDEGENYAEVFAQYPCHLIINTVDFVKIFADKPANFPPGTQHRYCNAGYLLAGLAIEHASGLAFRDYVHAEVFAKAGMSRSAYFDKRYAEPELAEGFDLDDEGRLEQNIYAYPPVGHADGGAFCTAGDLHAFLAALRGGELLSPASTEAFFTPQCPAGHPDVLQGFGLEYRADRWWKEGCSEGASGILQHFSGIGLDAVVLANSAEGAWPVVDEIQRLAAASAAT